MTKVIQTKSWKGDQSTESIARKVALLRGFDFLSSLSVKDLEHLAAAATWITKKSGETLITEGDNDQSVYLIRHGELRASRYTESGREICHDLVRAPTMVGEVSAIDGGVRTATLEVVSSVIAVKLTPAQFNSLKRQHEEVDTFVEQRVCRMFRQAMNRFDQHIALSASQRLEHALLRMTEEALTDGREPVFDPAPTHEEFAIMVNSNREAVTKHLTVLTNLGIIRRDQHTHRIEVLDVQTLRARVPMADAIGCRDSMGSAFPLRGVNAKSA